MVTIPEQVAHWRAMSQNTLSLPTRISHITHQGRELRVIRPEKLSTGIILHRGPSELNATANQPALRQLLAAWSLAAISTRSIVFLPLRQNAAQDREGAGPWRTPPPTHCS